MKITMENIAGLLSIAKAVQERGYGVGMISADEVESTVRSVEETLS